VSELAEVFWLFLAFEFCIVFWLCVLRLVGVV
jgi:hypothetical protein